MDEVKTFSENYVLILLVAQVSIFTRVSGSSKNFRSSSLCLSPWAKTCSLNMDLNA